MKNILYVDYVIKHIYVSKKAIWKAGNQVLVNFLASGSGSEIPFRIRIQESQSMPTHADPDPKHSFSPLEFALLPPKSMSSEKFDIKHSSVNGDFRKKSAPL
jgi:hypothetical protein